jgi:hypothetical protein
MSHNAAGWVSASGPSNLGSAHSLVPWVSRRPRVLARRPRRHLGGACTALVMTSDESADDPDPPFLPQTIEYALGQAQLATTAAMSEGQMRLVIALPMGRSRKNWNRLADMDSDITRFESATLAIHFAQLFEGKRIQLVLGMDARPSYTIPWMQDIRIIDATSRRRDIDHSSINDIPGTDAGAAYPDGAGCRPDVLIIGALTRRHREKLDTLLKDVSRETVVVLINCMLEVPHADSSFPSEFVPVYVCRPGRRCAYMYVGFGPHADGWHIYTETAVFEYEWVGRRDDPWVPTDASIEDVALARGARRHGTERFWRVVAPGCESGFWPFMTVSCRDVLPLPGHLFEKPSTKSAFNRRPFGFF